MKRFFDRVAKQGAAVLLSAALVFNASYFSAQVYSAGSEINAAAAGTDETFETGAVTAADGTLDTDYTYADGAPTVESEAALPSAETTETTKTTETAEAAAVPAEGAEMAGVMPLAAADTQTENSAASVTIGGAVTYYDDFGEAWNAASRASGIIKLLKDLNTTSVSSVGTVTLDLNGKTLTGGDNTIYVKSGTLTIEDSSTDSTGTVNSSKKAIYVENGSLVVNGGTFIGKSYSLRTGSNTNKNINIILNGGTYIRSGMGAATAVDIVVASSFIINDCRIDGDDYLGITSNAAENTKICAGTFPKIIVGREGEGKTAASLLAAESKYHYTDTKAEITDAAILNSNEIDNVTVVDYSLNIIRRSADQTMAYGGSPAALYVVARSGTGDDISYQWYSGDNVMDGETGSELVVPSDLDVGEYTYHCVATAGGKTAQSPDIKVTVVKSGSDMTAQADRYEYNYTDTVTVTAAAEMTGKIPDKYAADTLRAAPAVGQAALYYESTQVSEPVSAEVNESGAYVCEITANTQDIIAAGAPTDSDMTLTLKFLGNDRMESAEASVTIKIASCTHETLGEDNCCAVCKTPFYAALRIGNEETLYCTSVKEAWEKAQHTGEIPAYISMLRSEDISGCLTVSADSNIELGMSDGIKLSRQNKDAADSGDCLIDVVGKFTLSGGELGFDSHTCIQINNGGKVFIGEKEGCSIKIGGYCSVEVMAGGSLEMQSGRIDGADGLTVRQDGKALLTGGSFSLIYIVAGTNVGGILGEERVYMRDDNTIVLGDDLKQAVLQNVTVTSVPFIITEHPKDARLIYMCPEEEVPDLTISVSNDNGSLEYLWYYIKDGTSWMCGDIFGYKSIARTLAVGEYPIYCLIEDSATGYSVKSEEAILTVLPCPHEKLYKQYCSQCGASAIANVTIGDNTSYYFDVDKAFSAVMGKTAVLDLNTNHTIDGALEISSGTSLTLNVTNLNNLTVKGGVTVNKGGSLVLTGGVVSETNGVTVNGGSFTLDSGSIQSDGIPLDIISGRVTLKWGSLLDRTDKGTVIKIHPDLSGNYPYTVDDILSEEAAYGALDIRDGVWYWADTSGSPYEIAAKSLNIWAILVEITSQPEDTSVVYGNTPTLAIAAQDTDIKEDLSVTYQWYEVADDNTETILTGETNPELTPAGLKPGTWRYCCYATVNGCNLRSDTAAVTVTPAPLTITGAKIAEKVYDKTTAAAVTDVTFGGLVGNDSLKIDTDYTAKAVFDSAEAGSGRNVTVTVTLSRGGSYVLTDSTFIINNAVIEKAPQTLTVSEDAYTAVYKGDAFALKCKTNGDGKITYSVSGSKNVLGENVEDNEVITVSENGTVSITGAGTASVTVTLGEGKNYIGTDSKTISVLIEQLENVPNMPGSVINAAKSCDTLSKVKLPDGWQWSEDMALEVDIPVTARAVYVNADKNNYKNISLTITVTRSNCDHEKTSVKDAVEPGCVTKGYTGDTYCEICGAMTMSGTEMPPAGHKGGTAGCVSKAVCGVCGEEYGETDPDNHIHTETRNEKAATCTESGYSGEVVCTDCNDLIQAGNVTEALGHDYRSEITAKPTAGSEGVMTYTCSRCGDKYTESIPKPDKPTHPGSSGSVRPSRPSRPDRDDPKPGNTPSYPKPGNTDKPYIRGDNGKEGWDVIHAEIDITKDGGEITVEMNGTTVVPGEILTAFMGKDITLTFDMGDGVLWSVYGMNITAAVGNIDFGVKVGSSGIPVDVVNNVTGEKYSLQLSLSYDGEFGFKAVLSVEVGTGSAGCYASLFYYNAQSGEPEFISECKITEDGIANLEFTHASDYIVVVNEKSRFDEDDTGESSGTSDISDSADSSGTSESSDTSGSSTDSGESEPTSDDIGDSSESFPSSGESDHVEENPKTGVEMPFIAVLIAAAGAATAYIVTRRKKERRQ